MTHEPECADEKYQFADMYGATACQCAAVRAAYQRGMESAAAMAETRYHDMKSCGKPDDCVVIAHGAWLVSEDIRFVLEGGDYAKAVREMRHEDNLLDGEQA